MVCVKLLGLRLGVESMSSSPCNCITRDVVGDTRSDSSWCMNPFVLFLPNFNSLVHSRNKCFLSLDIIRVFFPVW